MVELPQLRMGKSDLDNVPAIPVPDGYLLRNFRPGDEAALTHIYKVCSLGPSTLGEVEREIFEHPCFKPERIFIVENSSEAVATAAAWYEEREPYYGYLHMLGVLPRHRRRKLGLLLTLATIQYTRNEWLSEQHVTTDDYRETAINLYLNLGYYPLFTHESHPGRWDRVAKKLERPEALAQAKAYQWPNRLERVVLQTFRKFGMKKLGYLLVKSLSAF